MTIYILTLEEHLPYSRDLFPELITHKISKQHMHSHPLSFYEKLKIQFVMDKKISRINFKRNRIFTGDSGSIAYDVLILTDTETTAFPSIKGVGKSGVYAVRRLNDVQQLMKNIPLFDTMVLESETLMGLKMASAMTKIGKEVIWSISGKHIFSSWLDEESARVIRGVLEDAGIRIMEENTIAEILGDTEVKAVRLKSGKVLGAQAAIFTDLLPDLKLFKDTDLQCQEQIFVDNNFRTNVANVFAVDQICNACSGRGWESRIDDRLILEQQGIIVAKSLEDQFNSMGEGNEEQQPVFSPVA